MAQEIYHRSEWGNPTETWGNVYLNADLTNELYKRASEYENSWVTDQLLNGVGTKPSIILTPTAYEDGILNSVKPQKTFGSELVIGTNSDMSGANNWVSGIGSLDFNINTTVAEKMWCNFTSGNQQTKLLNVFTIGKTYLVSLTARLNSGTSTTVQIGGFTSTQSSTSVFNITPTSTETTYTGYIIADKVDLSIGIIITNNNGSNYEFDNVSVKEVTEADFDFTRGSSATRVNEQGLVEDVQILSGELVQNGNFEQIGSELVTNGGFDTDSGWTKDSGWSIEDGQAICNGVGINSLQQSGITTTGKIYKLSFDIISKSNDDFLIISTNFGDTYINGSSTSLGTNTFYIKPTSGTGIRFRVADGTTLTIDNVSVKEVGQNWTLTSGAFFTENGIKLTHTPTAGVLSTTYAPLTTGRKYRMTYEITENNDGGIKLNSATVNTLVSTVGVHTKEFISNQGTLSIARTDPSGNDVTIDNISVVEVTDDTDLPRINYTNGEGSLLLENQSTNLITYSEDFSQSYWDKTSATVSTSTITDPTGGQNSFKLVPDSGTGGNRSLSENFTGLSGLHTQTVFAKKGEYNYIMLRTRNAPNTGVMFDLENGTFNVNVTSAAFDSAKIEDYGNGWFRCSMTLDPSQMTTSGRIYTSFSVGITGSETNSFDGDGTSGIYIFGAQFEQLSYATSYIPTEGSTVTRLADVCNNSGSSDLINSTEGVLYAEIASLNQILTQPIFISLSDSTINNTVEIGYSTGTNFARFRIRSNSGLTFAQNISVSDITQFTKMAIKYKSGDIKAFINGSQVYSNTTSFAFSDNLKELAFDRGNGQDDFEGNVKCVAVFNEALDNDQLERLTGEGYETFNLLAQANNYTII